MADDSEAPTFKVIREPDDISSQLVKIIGLDAGRLVAEIVATLIRHHDVGTSRACR
jgi:hypothetical protein